MSIHLTNTQHPPTGDAMKRYYALVYGLCDAYNDRKARKAKARAAVEEEKKKGPRIAPKVAG